MGRIKTRKIKSLTKELYDLHSDKLTQDFDANKKVVNALSTVSSKKIRNVIAGYATRMLKRKAQQEF